MDIQTKLVIKGNLY